MTMYKPPHPGEFIQEVYLAPNALSCRELSSKLNVAPSTLNRILKGSSGISPEMALRLSKALGRSPESWLAMQDAHDLWQVKQKLDLHDVMRVQFKAA
ncbi:MAG: HigA family addiction module antidote protein [Propionivibrio sp.]|jgi:addiction module HigA family antidote|uniref:HigA family addiction module antidote protein n=1 Tax=Candidatus Propionivibrio dominans TaxID=2954373 RepID=A0A9D7I7I8_9RHOO|nr:HigA family addiction module antidote protein [Candidatus Propionivibrio dominans]